jgi:flagella basal body P-ring formation protein FlgA
MIRLAASIFCLWSILCCFLVQASEIQDNPINKIIEELIYDKLQNDKLVIELKYDSQDIIKKINSNRANIDDISIESINTSFNKFIAKIKYHNGNSENISGYYFLFIDAPVTSRLIKIGEIITKNDLDTIRVKFGSRSGIFASSEAEVIGMQAKKNIAAGSMIKLSDLARQPVIKLNDPVNIVYLSGNIELKTIGVAMAAGGIGDTIKVKNESTGVVILGQIINRNTVQVGGE